MNRYFFCCLFFFCKSGYSFEWIQGLKSNRKPPLAIQMSQESLRDSKTQNFSDEISVDKSFARVFIPISVCEESNCSYALDYEHFNFNFKNKRNSNPLPSNLYRIDNSFSYFKKLESENMAGGVFHIGSSSDKPFSESEVYEYQANAIYFLNPQKDSSYLFMVNYSNMRSFLPNIPIPGVAYTYFVDNLNLVLGVPFLSFNYKFFNNKWSAGYFGFLPWSHRLRLSYTLFGPAQIYTEFEARPRFFKLKDLEDEDDRLIFEEKTARLGIRWPLISQVLGDFQVGRSFGRRIYSAEGIRDSKDWLEVIEDQTFFNFQIGLRF